MAALDNLSEQNSDNVDITDMYDALFNALDSSFSNAGSESILPSHHKGQVMCKAPQASIYSVPLQKKEFVAMTKSDGDVCIVEEDYELERTSLPNPAPDIDLDDKGGLEIGGWIAAELANRSSNFIDLVETGKIAARWKKNGTALKTAPYIELLKVFGVPAAALIYLAKCETKGAKVEVPVLRRLLPRPKKRKWKVMAERSARAREYNTTEWMNQTTITLENFLDWDSKASTKFGTIPDSKWKYGGEKFDRTRYTVGVDIPNVDDD
ncbi:hypothetical protein B0O99DRAFT_689923 [Bisporella sp. PMI_857]|nr:hypothetical protein B0O99DRAFT_689923 [Bisporella sp. PMI_857]